MLTQLHHIPRKVQVRVYIPHALYTRVLNHCKPLTLHGKTLDWQCANSREISPTRWRANLDALKPKEPPTLWTLCERDLGNWERVLADAHRMLVPAGPLDPKPYFVVTHAEPQKYRVKYPTLFSSGVVAALPAIIAEPELDALEEELLRAYRVQCMPVPRTLFTFGALEHCANCNCE